MTVSTFSPNRERIRRFDPDLAEAIETRSGQKVHLHSVIDEETGERRLYCHSEERVHKEEGIANRFAGRFESALVKLHEGLARPRARKELDHVWRSIGRISERSRGIAQHYKVDVVADPETGKAKAVTWEKRLVAGTMLTHPGVYCLRTNVIDWDQETLWRTYTMLTDLESVFLSLEVGTRPASGLHVVRATRCLHAQDFLDRAICADDASMMHVDLHFEENP